MYDGSRATDDIEDDKLDNGYVCKETEAVQRLLPPTQQLCCSTSSVQPINHAAYGESINSISQSDIGLRMMISDRSFYIHQ